MSVLPFSSKCPICGRVEESDVVLGYPSQEMWGKEGHCTISLSTTIHGRSTFEVCDSCLIITLEAILALIKSRIHGKPLEGQS